MKKEKEILVTVEGLSKKFCKDLKTSLWYGVKDLSASIFGKKQPNGLRKKEFWAVKDINFTLRRGECLGLIGHNGAGKSTLLKILNGLINPDEGKVIIQGKVGALIELGAGFNPILSGRENIYNNGAILGFTKEEIDAKIEDIIDFSEIREFIDMPVQNYSSGMKVRLGFSVAAQMEPDVLIIDEVLAVGDIGFRIKCLNRINELLENTAIIFVSHSMPQIAKICTDIILLKKGLVYYKGINLSEGIEKYLGEFEPEISSPFEIGEIRLNDVEVNNSSIKEGQTIINYDEDLIIEIDFNIKKINRLVEIDLGFLDKEMKQIAIYTSDIFTIDNINKKVKILIPNILFSLGEYTINIAFFEVNKSNRANYNKVISLFQSIVKLKVIGSPISRHASIQLQGKLEIL